jgi:hypothetical protein
MRTLFLAATAAAMLASPAGAQVYFDSGPGGFDLRVGRDFSYGERYDLGWRGAYASGDCRLVRSRMAHPNGRMTYRTWRQCD